MCKWGDNIKTGLKEIVREYDWINLAHGVHWRAVMNLWVS